MREYSYEPYVYRGALGGVLGYLLMLVPVTAYIWVSFGGDFGYDKGVSGLLLTSALLGLIGGPVAGSVIGLIIWVATVKLGREPKAMMRVLIGAGLCLTFSFLVEFLAGHARGGPHIPLFAALGGGLPGLLAHAKNAGGARDRPGRA
jgi:hypothetical protein